MPDEGLYAEGKRKASECRSCGQAVWIVYHGSNRNHTLEAREADRLRAERDEWNERADLDAAEVARLRAERDEARRLLGECFREAGGDTDGDEWPALWEAALGEVRALRESYEECLEEVRP